MQADPPYKKVCVGKVPVDVVTFDGLVTQIKCVNTEPRYIAFVNAKSVVDANENLLYENVLNSSWINSPDGMPVAKVVEMKIGRHQSRISGPDIFEKFMNSKDEMRHFLLGSSPQVLEKIQNKAKANIVGAYSPQFREPSNEDINEWSRVISASGATHVWVGLGAPKQDISGSKLAKLTNLTVIGVGAAFDFYAEVTKRSPRIMRLIGLEWLHRLVSNPRRFAKRYLIGNLKFIGIVIVDLRKK